MNKSVATFSSTQAFFKRKQSASFRDNLVIWTDPTPGDLPRVRTRSTVFDGSAAVGTNLPVIGGTPWGGGCQRYTWAARSDWTALPKLTDPEYGDVAYTILCACYFDGDPHSTSNSTIFTVGFEPASAEFVSVIIHDKVIIFQVKGVNPVVQRNVLWGGVLDFKNRWIIVSIVVTPTGGGLHTFSSAVTDYETGYLWPSGFSLGGGFPRLEDGIRSVKFSFWDAFKAETSFNGYIGQFAILKHSWGAFSPLVRDFAADPTAWAKPRKFRYEPGICRLNGSLVGIRPVDGLFSDEELLNATLGCTRPGSGTTELEKYGKARLVTNPTVQGELASCEVVN